MRLILSDSHLSTFSDLINQWLLWKLCYALRKKDRTRKKNKKAAFTVAWMKFLLNFQALKTTQERIIVETLRFSSSAPRPSTTTFTPETVHAVISVIHEKVYDIIQIEVSRKKLESSTRVASSSSKAETQKESDKVFYRFGGAAPNRVIKPRKQTLTLDGKKGRANLAERKMKNRTVHFNGLKNER